MKVDRITTSPVFGVQKKSINSGNAGYMRSGITTAGAWFGFGVGLDMLSRKCRFSKSPVKNSLAINGIIASAAGIFTFWKCRHDKSSAE